jgi:hypothetical protein
MDLRSGLQNLLDELHLLERRHPEPANRRCFTELRESLDGLLAALDRVGVVALLLSERESRRHPWARAAAATRAVTLGQCHIPEVRSIRARSLRIAIRAIVINNGGLILYTLPVVLFILVSPRMRARFLRFAVQAIDLHEKLGSAHVRVQHDVVGL